jgi:hypothetical protein
MADSRRNNQVPMTAARTANMKLGQRTGLVCFHTRSISADQAAHLFGVGCSQAFEARMVMMHGSSDERLVSPYPEHSAYR